MRSNCIGHIEGKREPHHAKFDTFDPKSLRYRNHKVSGTNVIVGGCDVVILELVTSEHFVGVVDGKLLAKKRQATSEKCELLIIVNREQAEAVHALMEQFKFLGVDILA